MKGAAGGARLVTSTDSAAVSGVPSASATMSVTLAPVTASGPLIVPPLELNPA